jgi:hypothetical protein
LIIRSTEERCGGGEAGAKEDGAAGDDQFSSSLQDTGVGREGGGGESVELEQVVWLSNQLDEIEVLNNLARPSSFNIERWA